MKTTDAKKIEAKIGVVEADMRETKGSIKNIQKDLQVLSKNLDMDRHDISEIKIEQVKLSEQVHQLSTKISRLSSTISDKIADKTEMVADEVLSKVVKQGKNKKMVPFWKRFIK